MIDEKTEKMRRLKDYKEHHIWKEKTTTGKIYYYLCDKDDEIINVFGSLKECKKWVDF